VKHSESFTFVTSTGQKKTFVTKFVPSSEPVIKVVHCLIPPLGEVCVSFHHKSIVCHPSLPTMDYLKANEGEGWLEQQASKFAKNNFFFLYIYCIYTLLEMPGGICRISLCQKCVAPLFLLTT